MSKERYLEQEINKDLRILELERQLAEAREENKKFFKAGLFACDDNRWNELTRKRSEDDALEELYQNYKKQLKEKGE